jgi:hypothetical protein
MSDYFGALVSRVLQPERSVQPRRRVPFEAVAPPTLDAPEPFGRESGQVRVEAGAPRSAAGDLASVMRDRTARRSPEDQVPAPTTRAARASQRAKAPDDVDAAPVVLARLPTLAERRIVGEPPARATANAKQQPAPTVGARRHAPVSGPSPDAVDARQRVEPTRGTTARGAAATSDPVIRIHIGRVDVRAVTTSVPAAPTRSRDPRRGLMTLEEYVRRGGRS